MEAVHGPVRKYDNLYAAVRPDVIHAQRMSSGKIKRNLTFYPLFLDYVTNFHGDNDLTGCLRNELPRLNVHLPRALDNGIVRYDCRLTERPRFGEESLLIPNYDKV